MVIVIAEKLERYPAALYGFIVRLPLPPFVMKIMYCPFVTPFVIFMVEIVFVVPVNE